MVSKQNKKQIFSKLILYFWLHLNSHIFVSHRDHGSASIVCVQGLVSFQVEFLGLCWCQMFQGQDWGLASRPVWGLSAPSARSPAGTGSLGTQWADVAFHCVNSHRQLISPTNLRPTVLAKPLPRTLKTELPPPLYYPASWVREDIFENKTCEINLWLWFFFFSLLETCWKPDSMMLIALSAFPNQYTCCALLLLSEENSRHRPNYELLSSCTSMSNSPYVFLTCWSVFLLSIASHILLYFFYWTTTTNPQRNK